MIDEWVDHCLTLAEEKADFYSGARKIIRARRLRFEDFDDDLAIGDAGYTKSKLTMLRKHYYHEESIEVAKQLWEKRKGQAKYGSVGFTCYNHFVKGDSVDAKRSKRASVFGPCIQSVNLTLMPDKSTEVDVYYRTTELFKKFPADLVFIRDTLLSEFDFSNNPIRGVNFHFANITIHPMYFVTIIPHLDNPVRELNRIRVKDGFFHNWVVKWTARYFIPECHRGIQKFAQAMRVHMDATKRVTPETRETLIPYLEKHHPGFAKEYVDPDEEQDE